LVLGFKGDAICLSGLTGTKLKCEVLGEYYRFWWGITSGGRSRSYQYPTAIFELNAATGEVCIEDTDETVLGSAGHALELKMRNAPDTDRLKVILVEENRDCYARLKNVVKRRWPTVSVEEAEGPIASNSSGVYLLNMDIGGALDATEGIQLGNAIYFFDPLRSVEYSTIEKVASKRMGAIPFRTGTEFIVFLFTSDWFLGREDFSPLPCTSMESAWSEPERKTVLEGDALFGGREWRVSLLNSNSPGHREGDLVNLYKRRLYKWFRQVLPLPFNPKKDQFFHLMICSNYGLGVRITRNRYASKTGNPRYSPSNKQALGRFRKSHPEVFRGLAKNERPLEWKLLWSTVVDHAEGMCDSESKDLKEKIRKETDQSKIQPALEWLEKRGYLVRVDMENGWSSDLRRYRLDWSAARQGLGVDPPPPLTPVPPKRVKATTRDR